MARRVDAVLIGAGPAAVAALAAAPSGLRIVVLTGAEPDLAADAHAKIRAVAYERREPPGLAEPTTFADGTPGRLHATAAEGGLAVYWGQQFVRCRSADPWPTDVFADYPAYERACGVMEALFRLSPEGGKAASLDGGYEAGVPRLVVGTAGAPDSGLLAMRTAFRALAAERGAEVLPQRAKRFEREADGMAAILEDGERLTTPKMLLAAGVVGSLRLALASHSEISAATFDDHSPYMLYTLGLDRVRRVERSDGIRHFNALTFERVEAARTRLFASAYRMGHAPMSLLLAAVGLPPLFRGLLAPGLADLVKPVQLWTERTTARLGLGRDGRATVLAAPPPPEEDPEARSFIDWLRAKGVRVFEKGSAPGGGFHYHAAKVSTGGTGFTPLSAFIEASSGGRAACIDASVLPAIGCRPHSLTAMAAAFALSGPLWRTA